LLVVMFYLTTSFHPILAGISSNFLFLSYKNALIEGLDEAEDHLLALDEALEKLAECDPDKARVVKLRYFGGLTHAQIGEVLQVSEPTVKRHWRYAKAWLYREMQGGPFLP
jgi:RNA polymerase sigma factor (sigma-70 family)